MRWLPRGTHTWSKFLKPSEVAAHLRANGMEITRMSGMTYSPLAGTWSLNDRDLSVNYLLEARKPQF